MTKKKNTKGELTPDQIKKASGGTGAGKLPSEPKGFGKKFGGGGGGDTSDDIGRTDDSDPIDVRKKR